MFAYALASTLCSEATNIECCLSLGAVFGCWSKIRIHVVEFGDSSEQVQVADEQLGRSETKHFYRLQEMRVRLFISPTLQIRFFLFLLLKQQFFLLIYITIAQN